MSGIQINSGGRINYLDVLRGLSMLMVIYCHVRLFSFKLSPESSPIGTFFNAVMVHMFFFISGYLAYKRERLWSVSLYAKNIAGKAIMLLLPTVVFWSILVYFQIHPWGFPAGFWFTEVLFEMFFIYFTVTFLMMKCKPVMEDIVLIGLCMLMFVFSFNMTSIRFSSNLCLYELGNYFGAFLLGIFCKKYNDLFVRFLSNKWLLTFTLVIPLANLFLMYGSAKLPVTGFAWEVVRLVDGMTLSVAIFALFSNHSDYWNRKGMLQKCAMFIGRRTLDLYMIHYFFLPSLPAVGEYFANGQNYTLEFLVVVTLTLVITGCSLAVSAFLRTSPILAKYLFGVSQKPKPIPSNTTA